jgi:Putative zinc-finger/HEAT repeats
MNCATDKEMLTAFFAGELEERERVQLQAHLDSCPDCQKEWETLKRVWLLMGELLVEAPSSTMQAGFQAILSTVGREISGHSSLRQRQAGKGLPGRIWQKLTGSARNLWQLQPRLPVAFGLILLLAGLGAGWMLNRPGGVETNTDDQVQQLSKQVLEMKQSMMVSLLVNPSASERIRAVGYTDGISKVNRQVADALLTTLNNDPNVNVRLVTLEALVKFSDDPVVREGLIRSIAQQDSPLMQSAIADVMVKLQEKGSVKSLQELLQKKELNEMVRQKIEQSIHRLI